MIQLLLPFGLLSVFSIFNQFGIQSRYGYQQILYVIAGCTVFIIVKRMGRRFFILNASQLFYSLVGILILTFFWGLEVKGSRRWLDFGFVNFQPSEFLKIVYLLYFSRLFASTNKGDISPFFFIKSSVLAGIPALVVLKQPDLGNAVVLIGVYTVLVLYSDIPKKYLLVSFLILLCFIPFFWLTLHDYQQARILSFVFPHSDTQGQSYNMIQAVTTVGSGKFLGRGLGLGTQSRLFFLPENNTDFAFSSLVEQFGFVGGFLIVLIEFLLIGMILRRAYKFIHGTDADTRFKFLFTIGLAALFFIQTTVNIGMNIGILPIAGIALPFISFGGSFVVSACVGFALLKT